MRTFLRKVWRVALESTVLFYAIKLYLDAVKILYRHPSPPEPRSTKSIFISFPYNSLGDVFALIPLLERIHKVWPNARLHVALGSVIAPFIDRMPFLKTIPVTAVPHKGAILWRMREIHQLVICYRRELRSEYYDISISPRWGSDAYARASRYLMYLANSKRRISYSATVDGGPSALDRLNTDLAFGGALEPESVRQIRILEQTAVIEPDRDLDSSVRSKTEALVSIAASVSEMQVREQLKRYTGRWIDEYVVVAPGATRASNRWPIERFGEVISQLHQQHPLPILVIGDKGDAAVCEALAKYLPGDAFSLGGKTSLLELAAIVRGAQLFIGNDSGPGHLAGRLGVRCVVLTAFASRSDQRDKNSVIRWRPNGPYVSVIQPLDPVAPCTAGCDSGRPHCILQTMPSEVIEVAAKQLAGLTAC